MPTPRPRRGRNAGGFNFNRAMWTLLEAEGPIAVIDRSYKGDLGTVFVSGARTAEGRRQDMDKQIVPQVTLSVEHYNRIFRMMNKGIPVTLSIDMETQYTNPDGMAIKVGPNIVRTNSRNWIMVD